MTRLPPKPPSKRFQTMYCRGAIEGRPLEATATEFHVTVDTVKRNVRKVRRWLKLGCRGVPKIDTEVASGAALRDLHVARLEHQWQELMSAWYRSNQPEETDKAVLEQKKPVKGERTRRTQTGDVKYLIQARAIMAEILHLNGGAVPMRFQEQHDQDSHDQESRDVEPIALEQRREALHQILALLDERAPAAGNVATDSGDDDSARSA